MIPEVQDQEGPIPEDVVLQHAIEELTQVQARIGAHFRRAEARNRAGRFVRALLAPVERKNGWQLAEKLGERSPHGVQRLLAEADWDEEAVRDELRRYVVDHLGEADSVLVVDETGFLKKGKKSAGVANQYSGAAYGLANSQVGVFVLYASARGAAFLDRDLYIPEEWLADPVRCREAGIPEEHTVTSKGELARRMLVRAFAAGVPAQWVVGDTLYGYDELRSWLEEQHKHYVLAIPETHAGLWCMGGSSPLGISRRSCHLEPGRCCPQGRGARGHDSTNGPGSSCLMGASPPRKRVRRAPSRRASCCCGARFLILVTGRITAWLARPRSRCSR